MEQEHLEGKFNRYKVVMTRQRSSQISFAALILCLLLGSLVVAPVINAAGSFIPLISIPVFEYSDHSEQFEFEEFVLIATPGAAVAALLDAESSHSDLDLKTADLASVTPPPKAS